LAEAVYGVEIDDGQHRLRVLFGDFEQAGIIESGGDHVVYRRAPLDVWSRQVIDLSALYAQMGWPQPLPTPRFARNIRYTASQVTLSLIVGARTPEAVEWVFGPIEQADGFANRQAVVKSALDHPDAYYVAVGDKYRSERNFDLAETAYLKALDYNAASSPAYFGLGESRFWLDNPGGARAAFQTALDLGYPDEGNARKGIGWSEYNLARYAEALRQFEAAVSAFLARDNRADDLSLADAYNGVGWSWLRLGDCAQAVSAFEQALEAEPDLPGPKDGLAYCAASGS
jgi:Flp pilus assembly protein TadD